MKHFTGALFIACQIAAGSAVAQVSGQVPETTAEPAARAAAQSWVNRRGKKGDTELHWMAFKGDAAVVRRLLRGGADVNKEVDAVLVRKDRVDMQILWIRQVTKFRHDPSPEGG